MSHLKERIEQNCLNCNTQVQGRYCHVCGQENIEPKESFWHLVNHFFADITHFDGKFFSTVKYLLTKPGFLAKEYMNGRRASYLHPVRMYVFTSAFFFLIFFSFYQKEEESMIKVNEDFKDAASVLKQLGNDKQFKTQALAKAKNDSAKKALLNKIALIDSDITLLSKDSTAINRLKTRTISNDVLFENTDQKYKSVVEYDSIQNTLPANKKDGFIEYRAEKQILHLKEKYHNSREIFKAVTEKFRHLIPQMLFTGLPLFALVLLLLYIRRKNFYYVNHVIFLIYIFCATFIIILGGLWLKSLLGWAHLNSVNASALLGFIFTIGILFYWYKSMRKFYEQSRLKTIVKYCIFLFVNMILMSLIFTCFILFSAMTL